METRKEFAREMVHLLAKPIRRGFSKLYKETRAENKVPRMILREFQTSIKRYAISAESVLADVPGAQALARRIARLHLHLTGNKIDPDTILQACLLEVARELWRRPFIFYHGASKMEQQQNLGEFDKLVKAAVKSVVFAYIPLVPFVDALGEDEYGEEELDPEDTEQRDPEDTEQRDPEDKEQRDPEDKEQRDPEDKEQRDPEDKEQRDPEDPEKDPQEPQSTTMQDSNETKHEIQGGDDIKQDPEELKHDSEDPEQDPEDPQQDSEDPEDPKEDPEDPQQDSEDPEDPKQDPKEDPKEDPKQDPEDPEQEGEEPDQILEGRDTDDPEVEQESDDQEEAPAILDTDTQDSSDHEGEELEWDKIREFEEALGDDLDIDINALSRRPAPLTKVLSDNVKVIEIKKDAELLKKYTDNEFF